MRIGVFDSGTGGELIAKGLRPYLKNDEFIVINDRENVPYGSRSNEEIIALTTRAVSPLIATCPVIVIACNTATMAGIEALRATFPDTIFVGTEPMIKPAGTASKSRRVTVLATPLTLQSARYRHLIDSYSNGLIIDEPSTAHWARTIEDGLGDTIDFIEVSESVQHGSDSIILACTHYIALKERLQTNFPDVTIYEPTEAIARQIQRLSSQVKESPAID